MYNTSEYMASHTMRNRAAMLERYTVECTDPRGPSFPGGLESRTLLGEVPIILTIKRETI